MIDVVAVMVTVVPTSAIPAYAAVPKLGVDYCGCEHPISTNLCSGVI